MKKNMDFIIVPRSIFSPDAFGREPYSKREAFLDLVQMAAYESGKMFMAGHTYPIERGQLVVSKSYLVKRWRWNVDKVRRFLQYLERNGMCHCMCYQECYQEHDQMHNQERYYPITLISIVSYDSYQGTTTSDATTSTTTYATTPATTCATQEKEIINNNVEEKKTSNDVKESSRFVKPTIEEVAAYCASRNNGIDPEAFVAFYESKGWKIGSSPMKSWKAAMTTWEKRRRDDGNLFQQQPQQPAKPMFTSVEEWEASKKAKKR